MCSFGVPSISEASYFSKYKPDVVYHAAAHKHVPLMEDSPCEAIKNNVLMVVESEGLEPTGIEEVRRCMEYLRTLD